MMSSGSTRKAMMQGNAKQQCKFDGAVLRRTCACVVAGRHPARHLRHQHGADRDADHPDRQLVDAVGVIERRQRTGRQEACNDRIGEQCKLGACRADGCGDERFEEAPHVFVPCKRVERRHDAGAPRGAADQHGLQHSRDQDAPRRGMAGTREECRQRQRRHHREVEQDRCSRGGSEAIERVEDAAPQRYQRDQQQIWKGDPSQIDGERELLRIARKSWCQQIDCLRRENQRQRQQNHLRRQEQRENAVAEQLCRLRSALGADTRIGRNEGSVERTFGKYGAEMVGQTEGNKKRVGNRPGADNRSQHDVAEKARQTRDKRIAADSENATEHCGLAAIADEICLEMIRMHRSSRSCAISPDPI